MKAPNTAFQGTPTASFAGFRLFLDFDVKLRSHRDPPHGKLITLRGIIYKGKSINVDVSLALLNGRRVAELGGSASRRLTLVRANTAHFVRGYAPLGASTRCVVAPRAGVAQLASR